MPADAFARYSVSVMSGTQFSTYIAFVPTASAHMSKRYATELSPPSLFFRMQALMQLPGRAPAAVNSASSEVDAAAAAAATVGHEIAVGRKAAPWATCGRPPTGGATACGCAVGWASAAGPSVKGTPSVNGLSSVKMPALRHHPVLAGCVVGHSFGRLSMRPQFAR